jgi:hypothetical protein
MGGKMKRFVLSLAMVMMVWAGGSALAADATAKIDLNSAYVWRGITFNDGLVAQPSIDVSKNGFGVNVWGNFDIDDYDGALDDNEFSEVDLTLYYGFSLEPVDIGLGLIEYLFPAGAESTREAYLSLKVPVVGGLSVGATTYYDNDQIHGWYTNAAVTYGHDLADKLGLEAAAKAGYADKDYAEAYGGEDSGFYDYVLSLSLSYAATETLTLGANINYVDTLDEDVLPDELVDTDVYGGINVAYAF